MKIDFDKLGGLVPAIIQDARTKNVLMLGFMNQEAYEKTVETGKVTFWSRTRNTLWTKGETSGNYLNVVSIQNDCDDDTLLIKVNPIGPTCHTGTDTCWGRRTRTTRCYSSRNCKISLKSEKKKCPKAHTPPASSARESTK